MMEFSSTSSEVAPSPHYEETLEKFMSTSEKHPNLDAIATGAEDNLEFIKSWIQVQLKNPVVLVVNGIQKQSGPYVTAIDQSVKMAEQACTFSADAIGLCNTLLDPDTKPEDLAEYTSEMRETASKAVQTATEVLDLFKSIRCALFQITKTLDEAAAGTGPQGSYSKMNDSADLQKALDGLQKFTLNVDWFSEWLGEMKSALEIIKDRAEAGTSRPRIKQVKQSWEKVGDDYKSYKSKIYAVRDQFRTIEPQG